MYSLNDRSYGLRDAVLQKIFTDVFSFSTSKQGVEKIFATL